MPDVPDILIHGLSRDGMAALCREAGADPFRARQIWQWLYGKLATDWDAMRNVPADLKRTLAERAAIRSVTPVRVEGERAGTRKILLELADGELIEEVLIPAPGRRTVCVSSQVGCRFNCAFCASGKLGFRRNLRAGEIVEEIVLAALEYGERPTNVVFMGIGEPFDNYDEVLAAVRILNDADGLGIGARRITISTSGVIPGIRRLADEGLQVELSVSLHAPDDALRTSLMPVNRKYPLSELLDACRDYTARTRRIITFEYTLIGGVNDEPRHAKALVDLLKPLESRVNLIPLSAVDEYGGRPPAAGAGDTFIRMLDRAGINATLRVSKGVGVNAACGQLRLRERRAADRDRKAEA